MPGRHQAVIAQNNDSRVIRVIARVSKALRTEVVRVLDVEHYGVLRRVRPTLLELEARLGHREVIPEGAKRG